MDGRLVWTRHLGLEYSPFRARWGHGSSPTALSPPRTMARTPSRCPIDVLHFGPLETLHTRTVPSTSPSARCSPFVLRAAAKARSTGSTLARIRPSSTLRTTNRALASCAESAREAITLPSALNATTCPPGTAPARGDALLPDGWIHRNTRPRSTVTTSPAGPKVSARTRSEERRGRPSGLNTIAATAPRCADWITSDPVGSRDVWALPHAAQSTNTVAVKPLDATFR